MSSRSLFVLFGVLSLAAGTTAALGGDPEDRAIRSHIERHYFDGVRRADTALAHRGFHPVTVMYFVRDGGFAQRTIPDWLEAIAGRGAGAAPDSVSRRIVSVDVTGSAAMAKLELGYPEATVTDYMSLLKVNGEWTIVGKIFDRRPAAARAAGR